MNKLMFHFLNHYKKKVITKLDLPRVTSYHTIFYFPKK